MKLLWHFILSFVNIFFYCSCQGHDGQVKNLLTIPLERHAASNRDVLNTKNGGSDDFISSNNNHHQNYHHRRHSKKIKQHHHLTVDEILTETCKNHEWPSVVVVGGNEDRDDEPEPSLIHLGVGRKSFKIKCAICPYHSSTAEDQHDSQSFQASNFLHRHLNWHQNALDDVDSSSKFFYWKKDDQLLFPHSNHENSISNNKGHEGGGGRVRTYAKNSQLHILHIRDFQKSDYGVYQCGLNQSLTGYDLKDSVEITGIPSPPSFEDEPETWDDSSYRLSWVINTSNPIVHYDLEFRELPIGSWVRITVPSNSDSYWGSQYSSTSSSRSRGKRRKSIKNLKNGGGNGSGNHDMRTLRQSYTLRGLQREISYQARIRCRTAFGESAFSSPLYTFNTIDGHIEMTTTTTTSTTTSTTTLATDLEPNPRLKTLSRLQEVGNTLLPDDEQNEVSNSDDPVNPFKAHTSQNTPWRFRRTRPPPKDATLDEINRPAETTHYFGINFNNHRAEYQQSLLLRSGGSSVKEFTSSYSLLISVTWIVLLYHLNMSLSTFRCE